ncbi:hypothetical protein ACFLSF_01390 [Candidatus Bipolaricaulota bacterium]
MKMRWDEKPGAHIVLGCSGNPQPVSWLTAFDAISSSRDMYQRFGRGVGVEDLDGDGDLDLFLARARSEVAGSVNLNNGTCRSSWTERIGLGRVDGSSTAGLVGSAIARRRRRARESWLRLVFPGLGLAPQDLARGRVRQREVRFYRRQDRVTSPGE